MYDEFIIHMIKLYENIKYHYLLHLIIIILLNIIIHFTT
jgi:hypothetical protein